MAAQNQFTSDLTLHDINPTGKEIGRGAYGRVFEIDYQGTLCAAKEVHALLLQYSQGDELHRITTNFLNECQIWSTIRHPCVVQFLGVYYAALDQFRLPIMVMEKMHHSLRGLVDNYVNIPLYVKLCILDDVCLGLRYLHSRNPPIVHRDLTPNNILLGGRLEAKITDLGVAKVMQTDGKMTLTKIPGTPDFMPPEALISRPVYGPPLDVFSYGAVVLNVITQQWPTPTDREQLNPDTDRWEVISEVARRQMYFDILTGGVTSLVPLVTSCLHDNPKKRPSVVQVSMDIKRIKGECSQQTGRDGMSPILWWAEVSGGQSVPQVTERMEEMVISREESLEENSALRTEINGLKIEVDALKTANDHLRVENNDLKVENNDLKVDNQGLYLENTQLKAEIENLKILSPKSIANNHELLEIKWQRGAYAPLRLAFHTAVFHEGKVYIGGGGNDPCQKEPYEIQLYDPVSNTWSPSPIKAPYCNFAMATFNNRLIIAGGRDKSTKATNLMVFLNNDQFMLYNEMITSRHGATAASYEGNLIIAGGEDDQKRILATTEVFDGIQWYTVGDLPIPHQRQRSVIVNGLLFLFAGKDSNGDASQMVFTAALDTLSSHKLKWRFHKDAPWCWSAPVSIQGRQLVIIGGWKMPTDSCTSDIHFFNEVSRNWEVLGQIPLACRGSAAVSVADNKIFVVGGYDGTTYVDSSWIGLCVPCAF